MHKPERYFPTAARLSNRRLHTAPGACSNTDVLVLGAGASGLMCAREAAGQGLSVVVLEAGASPGRKLAISGGGRANFSNREISEDHFRSDGARGAAFCVPALRAFTPEHMLRLLRQWNLPFEERTHGQLFLTVPAQRLAGALSNDCRRYGARIVCRAVVDTVQVMADGTFLATGQAGQWRAQALVLALGSPACPQAGGSAAGYRLAQSLGHGIVPPRPALTPLLLAPDSPLPTLTGISLPARISIGNRFWEDSLLLTHCGLSGPLALKASLYWQKDKEITMDFLPGRDVRSLFAAPQAGGQTPRSLLARHLPQRLVDSLLPPDTARRKIAELARSMRQALAESIHCHRLRPVGTAGFKKAEVCTGGVTTDEIDPHSMGSLICPRLFVIGELLDVTGLLGGYNLHWAWASGVMAGRSLLQKDTHE